MSPVFTRACRGVFLLSTLALIGCSEAAPNSAAASRVTADLANRDNTAGGITFTVSGPAFDQPQTFHVPNDTPELHARISDSGVLLHVRLKNEVRSENDKHRLDQLILRVDGGVGEYTESKGLENASLNLTIDEGSEAGRTASMKYHYSKGEPQPVLITIESLKERERVSGTFSARLQRTNSRSSDQFYELEGVFDVHRMASPDSK